MIGTQIDVTLAMHDQATAPMRRALADIGQQARGVSDTFGRMQGVLGGLGVTVGMAAVGQFLAGAVREAQEAERATRKLESVLRSTGYASGQTAEGLSRLAEELQITTGVEADVVMNAEAVLATFTRISGDTFPAALRAASDLSAVMGQDLQSSVVQIGKALNDPLKGLTALQRVGVSFTEAQKKQIKSFMDLGDVASADRVILAELQREFGGAAEAMQGPLSSALSDINLGWKDLQQTAGNSDVVIKSLNGLAWALGGVKTAFDRIGEAARDPEVREVLRGIGMGTNAWGRPVDDWEFSYASPSSAPRRPRAPPRAPRRGGRGAAAPTQAPDDGRGLFWQATAAEAGSSGLNPYAELQAQLRVKAALAATAPAPGVAGGRSPDAVAAYFDAQAEAFDRVEQAAYEAGTAVRAYWDTMASRQDEVGGVAGGRSPDAVAAYWDEMARQQDATDQFNAYNAGAVTAYWDEMAEAQDRAFDAEKVQEWQSAVASGVGQLAGVFGSTSALMHQLWEDSGKQADKYFRWYKATAMAETAISTAQGIMNVWTSPLAKFWPAAVAMSAAVGALGAAQIAMINQQQPRAMAEGGIVTRPTYALIGEAGPEAVIPLSRAGVGGIGHGDIRIQINVPVQGGMDGNTAALVAAMARQQARLGVREALAEDPRVQRSVRRIGRA